MKSFSVGDGPGGLQKINKGKNGQPIKCLPGSTHGGKTSDSVIFEVGAAYGKEDLTTFQGGSGGDVYYSFIICLCFLSPFLPFLLASHADVLNLLNLQTSVNFQPSTFNSLVMKNLPFYLKRRQDLN